MGFGKLVGIPKYLSLSRHSRRLLSGYDLWRVERLLAPAATRDPPQALDGCVAFQNGRSGTRSSSRFQEAHEITLRVLDNSDPTVRRPNPRSTRSPRGVQQLRSSRVPKSAAAMRFRPG